MLIIERVDNIAVLKINRPYAMNSLNNELLNELNCALEQIDSDEQIRVLIITGEGRAFVAGADIEQMSTMNVQQGKEFAILTEFGNGIDQHFHTGDIAKFHSLIFRHFIDIDIGRNLVVVDDFANDAHAVFGHEATDQGVETAAVGAVGDFIGFLKGANGFKFLGTSITALGILRVKTDRLHNAVVQDVSKAHDEYGKENLNDCFSFHIDILFYFFVIEIGCKDTKKM